MDATRTNGQHVSGQRGVTWIEDERRWRVVVRLDGQQVYVGSFFEDDLDRALACRREAGGLHPDDIPGLRERYGLGGRRGRARKSEGASYPPPVRPSEPLELPAVITLYQAAVEADSLLAQANHEAAVATGRAHAAEEVSIECWNRFADAVREQGRNIDSGFIRSKLGALLDREEP